MFEICAVCVIALFHLDKKGGPVKITYALRLSKKITYALFNLAIFLLEADGMQLSF